MTIPRTRTFLAAVLALSLGAVVGDVPPGPATEARELAGLREGVIVYARSQRIHGDEIEEIVASNIDGSGERELLPREKAGAYSDSEPAVSPDGSKIAFVRSELNAPDKVFVMNQDGAGIRRVDHGGGFNAVWAPDSVRLAYVNEDRTELHVVNEDGSDDQIVVSTPMRLGASWSPDGSEICYVTDEGLWIVAVRDAGTSRLRLANVPDAWYPLWSPDGSTIAFSGLQSNSLYFVGSDGSHLRTVTGRGGVTSWSPDSARVAGGRYTVERATGHVSLLTRSFAGEAAEFPVWSPDGGRIAYVRHRLAGNDLESGRDVWVMNSDGSSTWPITKAFPIAGAVASFEHPQWLRVTGRIDSTLPTLKSRALPAKFVRRQKSPISLFDADDSRVVFTNWDRGTRFWSLPGGRLRLFHGDCYDADLTIAGQRLAGLCSGDHEDQFLYSGNVGQPARHVQGRYREPFSGWVVGGGSLLTFSADQAVWAIHGHSAVKLTRVPGLRLIQTDGARIAALKTNGSLVFLRPSGAEERTLSLPRKGVDDFVFRGNMLVTLGNEKVRAYDVASGRLLRTWAARPSGVDQELEDVRGATVVYISGLALHVLNVRTGRDFVLSLSGETAPISARLIPEGLVYSYNEAYSKQPGIVGFVLQSALKKAVG